MVCLGFISLAAERAHAQASQLSSPFDLPEESTARAQLFAGIRAPFEAGGGIGFEWSTGRRSASVSASISYGVILEPITNSLASMFPGTDARAVLTRLYSSGEVPRLTLGLQPDASIGAFIQGSYAVSFMDTAATASEMAALATGPTTLARDVRFSAVLHTLGLDIGWRADLGDVATFGIAVGLNFIVGADVQALINGAPNNDASANEYARNTASTIEHMAEAVGIIPSLEARLAFKL